MADDPGTVFSAVARWHLVAWSMLLAAAELGINPIGLDYCLFFFFYS